LHWLVKTRSPLSWPDVKQLNNRGLVVISRHVLAHAPGQDELYAEIARADAGLAGPAAVVLVSGMAVLEIILLAGPAFAVGTRRRQRDLGLISASGGTPSDVRRIVLADGVLLGASAAGAGLALGIAVAAISRRFVEEHLAVARSGAFRSSAAELAAVAGLAVVTGALAAWVPAERSSKHEVVTALAGRRGITRSRRRWPILGSVLAAIGGVVAVLGSQSQDVAGPKSSPAGAFLILVGLALVELGLVLCTPALIGLVARLGPWLPLTVRMSLRDMARNRTAASPALSAVMAAVVASLAIGVVLIATEERERDNYRSLNQLGDDAEAAGSVAALTPGEAARATQALLAGSVVVDDPRVLEAGMVPFTITAIGPDGRPGQSRLATLPGFALAERTRAPIVLMTRATVESLGLISAALAVMAKTSRVPTEAEQDRLQASIGGEVGVWVERGPQSHPAALLVLAIVAGVIALGAAAIATGLCAADRHADLVILAAVGASPRMRRMLALSQSGLIAGLGSLLGTAAGLGAAMAVLMALYQRYAATWPAPAPYPITMPWLNVGIALVIVPVAAMLSAGLLSRSWLPIERRR
jgi:FtsX-like permease family